MEHSIRIISFLFFHFDMFFFVPRFVVFLFAFHSMTYDDGQTTRLHKRFGGFVGPKSESPMPAYVRFGFLSRCIDGSSRSTHTRCMAVVLVVALSFSPCDNNGMELRENKKREMEKANERIHDVMSYSYRLYKSKAVYGSWFYVEFFLFEWNKRARASKNVHTHSSRFVMK